MLCRMWTAVSNRDRTRSHDGLMTDRATQCCHINSLFCTNCTNYSQAVELHWTESCVFPHTSCPGQYPVQMEALTLRGEAAHSHALVGL